MSLRAQAARGLKWQLIEVAGRQILALVVFAILARLLEPSDFGLVALTVLYVGFVGMLAEQGIGTAIVQRKEIEAEHLDAAFWLGMCCASVLCLATVAIAGPVASALGEPGLVPLLRCGSLALAANALTAVPQALLLRSMDFRRTALRTLIANLAGGTLGVLMAVAGFGVWALIGQQLGIAFAAAAFMWVAVPWRPRLQFSFGHLRQLLVVGTSFFATAVLWFISSRLDQLVIGRFAGPLVLGQYVVATKLCDLARLVVHQPIGAISMPALSRLQGDHDRLRRAIYNGMELNAVTSFAVFCGLAAVAVDLVPLLFGEKWAVAAGVCAWLSIYALVNTLQVFFSPALLASGGPGGYVAINVVHVIGAATACLWGVRHGPEALVLGLIANGMVVAVVALLFLKSRLGLSPLEYCRPCAGPLVAAAFMVAAVHSVRLIATNAMPDVLRLCLQIAVGAAVYIGGVSLLVPGITTRVLVIAREALSSERPVTVTSASA